MPPEGYLSAASDVAEQHAGAGDRVLILGAACAELGVQPGVAIDAGGEGAPRTAGGGGGLGSPFVAPETELDHAGRGFVRRPDPVGTARQVPFVDVRLLVGNGALPRTYLPYAVVALCVYIVLYGITQWLEAGRGMSALGAGLPLPTSVISGVVVAPISRHNLVHGPVIVGAGSIASSTITGIVFHNSINDNGVHLNALIMIGVSLVTVAHFVLDRKLRSPGRPTSQIKKKGSDVLGVLDDAVVVDWEPLEGSFGLLDPDDEHVLRFHLT